MIDLAALGYSGFLKSDAKSFRGPCPACGGHRRFVIFVDNYPNLNGFCDQCNYKINHRSQTLSEAELAELQRKAREREENEKLLKLAKLDEFKVSGSWEMFHHQLTEEQRVWWEHNGVPRNWQDFWKLGYTPDRSYFFDGNFYHSPAQTIPKRAPDGSYANIDYRLEKPVEGAGRYRPEHGLPTAPFIASPINPEAENLVLEGSKKAMAARIWLRTGMNIFGIPSCNSWAGINSVISPKKTVVCLDPDAGEWAKKLAQSLDAKIIKLPGKIDDLINARLLTASTFRGILGTAR